MNIDLSGLAEKTKNEVIALYERALGAGDKHACNEITDHATKHFGDHPTRLVPDVVSQER